MAIDGRYAQYMLWGTAVYSTAQSSLSFGRYPTFCTCYRVPGAKRQRYILHSMKEVAISTMVGVSQLYISVDTLGLPFATLFHTWICLFWSPMRRCLQGNGCCNRYLKHDRQTAYLSYTINDMVMDDQLLFMLIKLVNHLFFCCSIPCSSCFTHSTHSIHPISARC